MLLCIDGFQVGVLAVGHLRQAAIARIIFLFVVPTFLVKLQETVELQDRAIGPQDGFLIGRSEVRGHLIENRALHLGSQSPLPDQFIELELVFIEIGFHLGRATEQVRRTNRLVRFLRVLRFRAIDAWFFGQVILAEIHFDQPPAAADRFTAERNAVRPHISDQTNRLAANIDTFIKLLRDLHCPAGAKSQFAAGFLLQGRSCEGRCRIAADRFLFDRRYGE